MKFLESRWTKGLFTFRPEPEQQARRIVRMQLHVVLPAKAGIIAVVLYYIFTSDWAQPGLSTHNVALDFLKKFFIIYTACNVIIGAFFVDSRRFPSHLFQWLVFVAGLLDGLFVSGLIVITDGFDSIAYWLFPVLIILNAISIPLAIPQIVLNMLLGVFYLSAGLVYPKVALSELQPPKSLHHATTNSVASASSTNVLGTTNVSQPGVNPLVGITQIIPWQPVDVQSDPNFPKFIVLWLLTVCCYGVQLLRRAIEDSREFAVREGQLLYAGRLSAEFAHQIKNPLAIINNAVFSLQRAAREGRTDISRQLEIIREEVERSDKIITQIMGYAQLSEGHVEKLDLIDEVNAAIDQAFPAAVDTGVRVERHYAAHLPPMLMQRQHLAQILINILQNAREALNGRGKVTVSVATLNNGSVAITITDTGPGIPPDKIERIFEQYYSTKEKGTGLGLAIVKHNVELYAGSVRAESELGKGARFILNFPPKTVMKPAI
ncbi:MAG TPA: ATP-binding protein [Candidatus Angelobacter sp.]|nr:ATP-binding protein [Candidatus Angelobacter sp.]